MSLNLKFDMMPVIYFIQIRRDGFADVWCACTPRWARKGKPEASTSKTAAGDGASSAPMANWPAPAAWDEDDQERPLPQHGSNGSAPLAGKANALKDSHTCTSTCSE